MTLRLPKPGLQHVLLCDASYYVAVFVIMVEDYVPTTITEQKKTYAPVLFGSQLFNTDQLKLSTYYKEVLALYFALDQFAHFFGVQTNQLLSLPTTEVLHNFSVKDDTTNSLELSGQSFVI